jgi:hypothetical protein
MEEYLRESGPYLNLDSSSSDLSLRGEVLFSVALTLLSFFR